MDFTSYGKAEKPLPGPAKSESALANQFNSERKCSRKKSRLFCKNRLKCLARAISRKFQLRCLACPLSRFASGPSFLQPSFPAKRVVEPFSLQVCRIPLFHKPKLIVFSQDVLALRPEQAEPPDTWSVEKKPNHRRLHTLLRGRARVRQRRKHGRQSPVEHLPLVRNDWSHPLRELRLTSSRVLFPKP